MNSDVLEIGNVQYPVKIFKEHRHDVRASIRNRSVIIRVPLFFNRNEAAQEILKMKLWAKQKLSEHPELLQQHPVKTYMNGERVNIGNEEYLLDISFKEKEGSSARILDNMIYFTISSTLAEDIQQQHISTLLSRCMGKRRIAALREKVTELNRKHFNQPISRIFFKNTASRWGSCSDKGNINISTRLLFAPADVLEYVCIHELAHLIEQNHSEKFWKLVEKAMPDYKEKIRWLKENSKSCVF
ncbi:MAG: SprT family zinc-dependent metalloprotease [Nanoarchaeota archaeon]